MDTAEREQSNRLLEIYQRRIALIQKRIEHYYQGNRDLLPYHEQMQLMDDERHVAELQQKLED